MLEATGEDGTTVTDGGLTFTCSLERLIKYLMGPQALYSATKKGKEKKHPEKTGPFSHS